MGSTFFVLFYWCIPLLILLRYQNDWRHRWHVWGAWACTTVPILWELIIHKADGPLVLLGGHIFAPPIAALIGVILGEILFRTADSF